MLWLIWVNLLTTTFSLWLISIVLCRSQSLDLLVLNDTGWGVSHSYMPDTYIQDRASAYHHHVCSLSHRIRFIPSLSQQTVNIYHTCFQLNVVPQ
jgi:adenosyl cobinamide kinase/adenosyl cobinamide phosphate guanylyltransferase